MLPQDKSQYCMVCRNWKPERAHHCSVCETCVLKMDHHCPWLGNCVGYHNFKEFFLFTFYQMARYTLEIILIAYRSNIHPPGSQVCILQRWRWQAWSLNGWLHQLLSDQRPSSADSLLASLPILFDLGLDLQQHDFSWETWNEADENPLCRANQVRV